MARIAALWRVNCDGLGCFELDSYGGLHRNLTSVCAARRGLVELESERRARHMDSMGRSGPKIAPRPDPAALPVRFFSETVNDTGRWHRDAADPDRTNAIMSPRWHTTKACSLTMMD